MDHLKQYKNICQIKLGNNQITSLKDLEPLKSLENLESLDLTSCPISNESNIEKSVFKLLTKLVVFNGKDQEGNSVYSDDEDFEGEDDEYDGEDDEDFEGEDGEEEFDEDEDFDEEDDA